MVVGEDPVRLLARAATLDAVRAREAWRSLIRQLPLDDINGEAFDLLPAVAQRTDVVGGEADHGRLQGIYRQTWVRNELLLNRARPAFDALAAAGVPMVFTGGAAMPRWYRAIGARPIAHVDVIVPTEQARKAIVAMGTAGWRRGPGGRYRCGEAEIGLHDRAIPTALSMRADRSLWARADPGDGKWPVAELHAADLLLQVLVRPRLFGPVWTVDAYRLIETMTDADLASVVATARSYQVVGACVRGLREVAETIERAPVAPLLALLVGRGPGLGERLSTRTPRTRAGRATGLLARHRAGGLGLASAVASAVSQRLDLDAVAQPAATVAAAMLGRPRRLGGASGAGGPDPVSGGAPHLLTAGNHLDLTDELTLLSCAGPGWTTVTASGARAHGSEARLLFTTGTQQLRLRLEFTADQPSSPLVVAANGETAGMTPGGGARSALTVNVGPGVVELAFRSSHRRGLWPRQLFFVLRSIQVSACE